MLSMTCAAVANSISAENLCSWLREAVRILNYKCFRESNWLVIGCQNPACAQAIYGLCRYLPVTKVRCDRPNTRELDCYHSR